MKGFRRPKRVVQRLLRLAVMVGALLVVGLVVPYVFMFVGGLVVAPIHAVSNWVGESAAFVPRFLRDRDSLTAEISRLEAEVATARSANIVLQRLRFENDALRAMTRATSSPRIPAFVTARPPQLPYDIVQMDVGSQDGVVVGAPVFAGTDQLIGLVSRVTPTYSFAELMTSSQFIATAYLPESKIAATFEGMGGGVGRVLVPQDVPINTGDPVLFPSSGGGVYGAIVHVENIPTQPEQYGYVTPARSLYELSYVSVALQPLVKPTVADVQQLSDRVYEQSLLIPGAEVWARSTTSTSTTATSTDSNSL